MTRKSKKGLIVGLVLIIILAAVYVVVMMMSKKEEAAAQKAEEESAAAAIVLSVKAEELREISFPGTDGPIDFVKEDSGWIIPGDDVFVMDDLKLKKMFDDLGALTMTRELKIDSDLAEYGLGEKARPIKVTLEGGDTHTIYLGSYNENTRETYFQVDAQGSQVYLTDLDLAGHFGGTPVDYALYEECPKMRPAQMRIFDVHKGEDSYLLTMPGDDTCTVTDIEGTETAASLNAVGIVQENLALLSWAENVEYNCGDFEKYGLGEGATVVDVTCDDGESTKELTLSFGSQTDNGRYYVRLNDSLQVHTVRSEYVEDLVENRPTAYWSMTYSFVSIGDLDRMEVTYQGETHVLTRTAENEGHANEKVEFFLDGKQVAKEPFTNFYYACVSVTAQERLSEVPAAGKEPVLTLKYALKDGSEKTITYEEYDQNFYTVIYEDGTKAGHTNKLYVKTMLDDLEVLLNQ